MIPPDPTPILEALALLPLTDTERDTCAQLVGVRTMHDLRRVLERGVIEPKLAAKLTKVLKP